MTAKAQYAEWKHSCATQWPEKLSPIAKKRLLTDFYSTLGPNRLSSLVCAICSAAKLKVAMLTDPVDLHSYDISPLRREYPPTAPHPFPNIPFLRDIMLSPEGVVLISDSSVMIHICKDCHRSLQRKRLPNTAIANDLFFGPIPSQLADLTLIKEALIARRRAKSWIIHLRDDSSSSHTTGAAFSSVSPVSQRALKGHIIVFPATPEALAPFLPPPLEDVVGRSP
ncbi:uncharacterized protein EI90DRAFT_3125779 [Cantharellus anzutake]|uniref:uncharacterized protein n=1 Tax=Cantharellus anzutake TaxID=1750568 RepID=UPI001907C47E|nr:uncharacterized protein EI90DRAFT_3125779 [Cantharellus anzutake]KAF8328670.1 hypothetical protein EI90DRAFT_3125779 [Cantharellus anzutake]